MKFKSILTNIFVASVLAVTATSCGKDFLDEKMFSNYSPEASDVEAKLLAVHASYRDDLSEWANQQYINAWQIGCDIMNQVGLSVDCQHFYKYEQMTSEATAVRIKWMNLYELVNRANIVIATDPEIITEAQLAEAKFFRAMAYDFLATYWGGVPLILESTAVPRTDYVRNTLTEVNNAIINDIEYAVANLPALGKAANEARINVDMARMLAARIYLRIGKENSDASYYTKAEEVVTPVITDGNYSLINKRYGIFQDVEDGDYYCDMFRFGNQRRSQGNTEAVWTVQQEISSNVTGGVSGSPQQRRNWLPQYFNVSITDINDGKHTVNPISLCDSLGGRGLGRMFPTNYVKNQLFDAKDIRNSNFNFRRVYYANKSADALQKDGKYVSYYVDKDGFRTTDASEAVKTVELTPGSRVYPSKADTVAYYQPCITKWGAFEANNTFGFAMVKDFPIMRFSEAYLLRAEARVQLGNTSGAADDINVIRDRAFQDARATDINAGVVSASEMTMDFIMDERIRELIGEEERRQTLVRAGMLGDRIAKYADKTAFDEDFLTTGFQDYNKLLPIPYSEILYNKDAVLEQNPGYE